MNKTIAFAFLVLFSLCAAFAVDSDEALGRAFFQQLVRAKLRRNLRRIPVKPVEQISFDEEEVESDSQGACDSVKYRSEEEVQAVHAKVAAAANRLDELKKGLTAMATRSQAMLTGSQVAAFLKLFPTAAKVDALNALDAYFYLIDPASVVAILRSMSQTELCGLGDFQTRILDAADANKRSCVFAKVDSSLVMFVIDISPSMWYTYKGVSRIDMVRQELTTMLKSLKPEQLFNIATFGGSVYLWKQEAVKATEANINEAIRYMNARTSVGYTNINDSLEVALGKIPATVKDATIFFLTDGVPNAGKFKTASGIIDNITALNHKRENPVKINTISFLLGVQKDEVNDVATSQQITTQVAAKNGGVARSFAEQ